MERIGLDPRALERRAEWRQTWYTARAEVQLRVPKRCGGSEKKHLVAAGRRPDEDSHDGGTNERMERRVAGHGQQRQRRGQRQKGQRQQSEGTAASSVTG